MVDNPDDDDPPEQTAEQHVEIDLSTDSLSTLVLDSRDEDNETEEGVGEEKDRAEEGRVRRSRSAEPCLQRRKIAHHQRPMLELQQLKAGRKDPRPSRLPCRKCHDGTVLLDDLGTLVARSASSPNVGRNLPELPPLSPTAWAAGTGSEDNHRPLVSRSWQVELRRHSTKITPLDEVSEETLPSRCRSNPAPQCCVSFVRPKTAQSAPVQVTSQPTRPDQTADVTLSQDSIVKEGEVTCPPSSQLQESALSSTSTLVCRICQLGETESGEPVKITDCDCRGGLELIHRSCLIEWVRYKGNNVCELCNTQFADVTLPERTESDLYRMQVCPGFVQIRRQILRHYASQRPISGNKRCLMAIIVLVLAVVTTALLLITVKAEKQFVISNKKNTTPMGEQRQSYIRFAFCWSFLLFCGSIFLIILIFWICLETSVAYHRWRVRGLAHRLVESLFAPPHPHAHRPRGAGTRPVLRMTTTDPSVTPAQES